MVGKPFFQEITAVIISYSNILLTDTVTPVVQVSDLMASHPIKLDMQQIKSFKSNNHDE